MAPCTSLPYLACITLWFYPKVHQHYGFNSKFVSLFNPVPCRTFSISFTHSSFGLLPYSVGRNQMWNGALGPQPKLNRNCILHQFRRRNPQPKPNFSQSLPKICILHECTTYVINNNVTQWSLNAHVKLPVKARRWRQMKSLHRDN